MKSTSNRRPGSSDQGNRPGKRALVIRIGALGDVLLTRRLCYSLSLAGYRSTLLAPARHASLLLVDPWIDGVLDSESPRLAGAFAGLWPEETGRFDAALVISSSEGLADAAGLAATTVLRISAAPQRQDLSIAQQWADAARPFCGPVTGEVASLDTIGHNALTKGSILIHPGSGSPSKNWPIQRFALLARELRALGHRVAWIRGPAEADLLEETPVGQVIDRPTLQALAATLGQSMLYIGNDSGVSHLAAAVGAPTLAIFGPTNARIWTPDGPRVETLSSPSGSLDAISVAEVLTASVRMTRLGRGGASPADPASTPCPRS